MSGGVDSSVAAALLKEQGHDVKGVIMKIWDGTPLPEEKGKHACYGPGEGEDIDDARAVAELLGIPLLVVDLAQEYRELVLGYVRREYLGGRTPNPCVICNHRMKFGLLLDKTLRGALGGDRYATGHYVRVGLDPHSGRWRLEKGRDQAKDQSYFLYALDQQQLATACFPLGELQKAEVREHARRLGLPVKDKAESQDFVAGGDYTALLGEQACRPGEIVDGEGNLLGRHKGIGHYTVGQRKGLGLQTGRAFYVTRLDAAGNRVVVGSGDEVFARECVARELRWMGIEAPAQPLRITAKIRASHRAAEAQLIPRGADRVRIRFAEPQRAVTPGQAVVFYDGEAVLGGGIIGDRV